MKRAHVRSYIGLITLVPFLLCGSGALGFALIGPSSFGLAFFVPFGNGWSWPNAPISVRIHPSFSSAFGQAGVNAFNSALATWDNIFLSQATGAPVPGGGLNNLQGASDLESVALHELGHAIGLDHPDQAAAQNRNFNAAGNAIAATTNEMMNSVIAIGEAQRNLNADDLAGFNHLYPLFDLNFTGSINAAQVGPFVGADIDVFATVFSGNAKLAPFAGVLALANVGIAGTPLNGPGNIFGADIFFNIPEPGTAALLGFGLVALLGVARRIRMS